MQGYFFSLGKTKAADSQKPISGSTKAFDQLYNSVLKSGSKKQAESGAADAGCV